MTILQASLDRTTADEVAVDTTGAADADLLGAAERRTFRAATLEEAVAAAASELGDAVTVIEANRIRRGGLGGFFATDLGVEVVVEKSPGVSGSTTDAVDRLLERFSERETDSFTPSIDRVEISRAAPSRNPDAPVLTPQTAPSQAVTRQQTAANVAARIESALKHEAPTLPTSPLVDDDGPIFDLSDDEWDDDGPIFDLSDDADTAAAPTFSTDDETPAAEQRPPLSADDDVFAPVAPEQHPFADQLEAELRAMSASDDSEVSTNLVEPAVDPIVEPAVDPIVGTVVGTVVDPVVDAIVDPDVEDEPEIEPIDLIKPIRETGVEVRPLIEPAIPAGLVEAPRNSPPPILDMLATPASRSNTIKSDDSPNTRDVETEDAALADLDALLRRAGVDPLAAVDVDVDVDLAPTLVDRPTPSPMPSSGLVFDAADRLSEQLSAIDGMSGRNEGLRRMQVKITGPDGTLVEMSAEWDDRG